MLCHGASSIASFSTSPSLSTEPPQRRSHPREMWREHRGWPDRRRPRQQQPQPFRQTAAQPCGRRLPRHARRLSDHWRASPALLATRPALLPGLRQSPRHSDKNIISMFDGTDNEDVPAHGALRYLSRPSLGPARWPTSEPRGHGWAVQHTFHDSQGSAYSRSRHALDQGNILEALSAAAELSTSVSSMLSRSSYCWLERASTVPAGHVALARPLLP